MEVIVNKEWAEKSLEKSLLIAVRIVFLFTNEIKKTEHIVKDIFIGLLEEERFESERHFLAWLIRESIKTGKRAKLQTYSEHKIFNLEKGKRVALYLGCCEGYNEKEISGVMHISDESAERKMNEAILDFGSGKEEIKNEINRVLKNVVVSPELKSDLMQLMEIKMAGTLERENVIKKENRRKINVIVYLVVIIICLCVGSGIFGNLV